MKKVFVLILLAVFTTGAMSVNAQKGYNFIKSFEDAKKLYQGSEGLEYTDYKELGMKKMIENATKFEEAEYAYKECTLLFHFHGYRGLADSESEERALEALEKMLELSTTFEEAETVLSNYRLNHEKCRGDSCYYDKECRAVLKKELKLASNFKEAKSAALYLEGKDKKLAVKKMIEYSSTKEEAEIAYLYAPQGSKERELAKQKMAQLIIEK